MQAAQLSKYAKNFKLVVADVAKPQPAANEVLIQVKAAAVNPLEMLIGTGSVKLIQNYTLPVTMGNELAGVVVANGATATKFAPGDAVYARLPLGKIGAFAEYVCVDQDALALKPTHLDFEHAAAVPLTGLTAYQGLVEELAARPGQTVMIPGGSGSFGQLAIPIAKSLGLKVFVSGNQRSQANVLALGADQYFDYRQTNYWEALSAVDFVIDTLGHRELDHELAILKPGGRLLSLRMGPNKQFAVSHHLPGWKKALFTLAGRRIDRLASQAGVDYRFIFVRSDGAQLERLTQLVEEQRLEPAIHPRKFALQDVNAALDLVANGHPQGKVLITFD